MDSSTNVSQDAFAAKNDRRNYWGLLLCPIIIPDKSTAHLFTVLFSVSQLSILKAHAIHSSLLLFFFPPSSTTKLSFAPDRVARERHRCANAQSFNHMALTLGSGAREYGHHTANS